MSGPTLKQCSCCGDTKQRADFSTKQWKEVARSRRCTPCIQKQQTNSYHTHTTNTNHTNHTHSHQHTQSNKNENNIAQSSSSASSLLLLDAAGDWFVPCVESALSEIFDRFDVDGDGCWNIAETQSFAVAVNGVPFTTAELYQVIQHFDRDKSGKWLKKGFLQFYHLQTESHPAETLRDLARLGYDANMKLRQRRRQVQEHTIQSS